MTKPSYNQLCTACGGELQDITITHEEKRGTHIFLFENVRVKTCTNCHEIWIDEKVLPQSEG